jgi:hypothetical protein
MTTRELRLRYVKDEAQLMLAELGVVQPKDLDLERMAAAHGADIVRDDLDGATARVIRIGNRARIYVSTRIDDIGSNRFSTVHEVGHLRLGHRIKKGEGGLVERVCTPLRGDGTNPEREASVFAAEALMPEGYVRPQCAIPATTMEPVNWIARECTTSALASALRYVELTPECCAVVYCELGRVRWVKRSASFADWIPKGRPVDHTSVVADYFERGAIDGCSREVTADCWLPRERTDGSALRLMEHATVVPELGVVFALLWMPQADAKHIAA